MLVFIVIQVNQTDSHELFFLIIESFLDTPVDDHLPSYTDLFVVPSNCKGDRRERRNTFAKN